MTYIYGHHKVRDFDTWKPVFDNHEEVRLNAGMKLVNLFNSADDRNEVHWLFEVDSLDKMTELMLSDEMKQIQIEAGVLDEPHYHILKDV